MFKLPPPSFSFFVGDQDVAFEKGSLEYRASAYGPLFPSQATPRLQSGRGVAAADPRSTYAAIRPQPSKVKLVAGWWGNTHILLVLLFEVKGPTQPPPGTVEGCHLFCSHSHHSSPKGLARCWLIEKWDITTRFAA